MTQKILITGAHGFLASFLIALLDPDIYEIFGLDLPGKFRKENKFFTKIYDDIDNMLFDHSNFSIIFHFASFIPYGKETTPDIEFIKSNIKLTESLALKYNTSRFILASSVSVFGQPIELPLKINSPFNNPNLYGLSKIGAEAIVRNLLSYGIVRFSSLIGPEMNEISFIPKIIREAKENGEITLLGNGSRIQDYIDVRDAARLCKLLGLSDQNQIILGVSGNPVSNKKVAQIVAQITKARIKYLGNDKSPSFYYNVEDKHLLLDFQPEFSIEESIQEIIQ